jgi:hypothetical protein
VKALSGLRSWLRHPSWAWTVRRAAPLAVIASLAGWFFGVGIGKILELLGGGLKGDEVRNAYWIMGAGLAVAAVLYLFTLVARRGRDRMLRTNGTAFVVMEKVADWTRHFDHGDFYRQARRRFSRVVEVPGPGQLGAAWEWPLDSRARYWEQRFSELVASFRALYQAETRQTDTGTAGARATGVFVTAAQPVAMALGYRLRSAVLDSVLAVWQRPSNLRAGKVDPVIWGQRGHLYDKLDRLPKPEKVTAPEKYVWDVTLTVDRSKADPDLPVPVGEGPVSLLLIRFGGQQWAELPGLPSEPGTPGIEAPGPVAITLHDLAGVIPVKEKTTTHLHELRCVPPGTQFAWDDSPYLVNEAVAWIRAKTEELRGHTLLLGTAMPNDVAIGIGLAAGLPACEGWPEDLWPIVHRNATGTRVVPRLNLGHSAAAEPGT